MDKAKLQKALQILRSKFGEVWSIIFNEYPEIEKSNIQLEEWISKDTGYYRDSDTIIFRLPESNIEEILEDKDIKLQEYGANFGDRHIWLIELVHETIHCYQYKVHDGSVTPEGQELVKEIGRHQGSGHEDDYYTCVCIAAKKFGFQNIEFGKHCI